MPFVQAKCPECGGMLAVDDSKKAAVCQFCGEAFIVQEAVNNYITNNNIDNSVTHNYGDGAVVNVYEDNSKEFIIEGGVLKKYQGESLTPIVPEGVVAIEGGAFKDSMITKIMLPSTLKEIRAHWTDVGTWKVSCIGAFEGCKNLKEINLPLGLKEIPSACFRYCNGLTIITIPSSVTNIGSSAFSHCTNLESVIIPDGVTKIGHDAFWYCENLKSVTIPRSVNIIERNAFGACANLTNVYISDISAWCNIKFVYRQNGNLYKSTNPFCFAQNLYLNGKLVTDLSILDGLNTNNAFEGWSLYNNFLMKRRQAEEQAEKQRLIAEWKQKGLCQHCGSYFKGFFSKTCSKCGKPKDY